MRRVLHGVIVATLVVIATGPARALDCTMGVKVSDDCRGISSIGCCEGPRAVWCEAEGTQTALCSLDCFPNPRCGFNAELGIYDCGTNGGADAVIPKACMPAPACSPDCSNDRCGPDGCLGVCPDCSTGHYCDSTGHCATCEGTCEDKACGYDACFEGCGDCPDQQGCDFNDFECTVLAPELVKILPKSSPGCPGCECETCTCGAGVDPFCCEDKWDLLCTYECAYYCGGPEIPDKMCIPDCSEAICGDDKCGGSCGSCPTGTACIAGNTCKPCACDTEECGFDECGKVCPNTCAAGESCVRGSCVPTGCMARKKPTCDACICQDCVCGIDPFCCAENGEWDAFCLTHLAVCRLSDAACTTNCPICVPDCEDRVCGSDGCGGSCGTCAGGAACDDQGLCCIPNCEGQECGDDGCGGSCGACPTAYGCVKGWCVAPYPVGCFGTEVPSAPVCPSSADMAGCCDARGRVVWCDNDQLFCIDCPVFDMGCGWMASPFGSGYDCGGAYDDPSGEHPRECRCEPQCGGRICGPDGCGGVCGTCGEGFWCDASTGACVSRCIPSCVNRNCGDDGCGGTCGTCGNNGVCEEGRCVCAPSCAGKECGDDGCGGTCPSTCQSGEACKEGRCVEMTAWDSAPIPVTGGAGGASPLSDTVGNDTGCGMSPVAPGNPLGLILLGAAGLLAMFRRPR